MPAHKLFQRPVVVPHLTHEQTKSFNLGVPEDRLTFATTFIGTIDHIATQLDAFYLIDTSPQRVDVEGIYRRVGAAAGRRVGNVDLAGAPPCR